MDNISNDINNGINSENNFPGRALGVDYGDVRTGLAISDFEGKTAVPLATIVQTGMRKTAEKISQTVRDREIKLIVLGYPKNLNNTAGERAEKTAVFAETLMEITGISVILWDERRTTLAAGAYLKEAQLFGKRRKAAIDSVSAQVILQNYLDYINRER